MKTTLKALALGGIVVASALAGAGIHTLTAEPVIVPSEPKIVDLTVAQKEEAFKAGVASVPIVDVKAIETKAFEAGKASVKIDTISAEKLKILEQVLVDNNGDLTVCTEDLDDDEAYLVGDCAVFMTDIKNLALNEAKKEIADLADKKVVSGVTIDEDDVERIKLNDDLDEVKVSDLDFEDKDATVLVSGTFEHEDIKYDFEVEVEFKDGSVDDVSLESLELA